MKRFSGNAKFLLAGEYAVVNGALGFAVPLKYGQELVVRDNPIGNIIWKSSALGKEWFNVQLNNDLTKVSASDDDVATKLVELLKFCIQENPNFQKELENKDIKINADFNLSWGLGSSSTLVYTLAKWAQINPYKLQYEVFGGSGFDIACAASDRPLFFKRNGVDPEVNELSWSPRYKANLAFVYLGKKMNSRTSMKQANANDRGKLEHRISELSKTFPEIQTIEEIENVIVDLEKATSIYTGKTMIKEDRFADYPYQIKSLGAWGGDFVLVTHRGMDQVKSYFQDKGLEVVKSWDEMVL